MRIAAALALLAAACGPADPPAHPTNGAAAPPPGEPDPRIECRVNGAARYERVCSIEEAAGPGGQRVVILRKPDGGFRRLLRRPDSPFYVAADGAERADVVQLRDGATEVSIGGDAFRLGSH